MLCLINLNYSSKACQHSDIFRKPPGGECSNIFGEAETVVKVSTRPNPSLQSSIFSDETCKPVPSKPKTSECHLISIVKAFLCFKMLVCMICKKVF